MYIIYFKNIYYMTEICFDKYVSDINDIQDSVDGYNDVDKDKNCNYFDGKSPDRTRLDIINGVSPHDGCCFSISDKKDVIKVRDFAELESYIEKLKKDYKRIFIDRQLNILFDTIGNSQTLETFGKKRSKKKLKDEDANLLKHYQRLFLGVEQDENKLKKLIRNFENVSPFNDIQTFNKENEKLKEFRDVGSEEQKIFFYDKKSYATYEAFFYGMLSVVSILFLRTQIKN